MKKPLVVHNIRDAGLAGDRYWCGRAIFPDQIEREEEAAGKERGWRWCLSCQKERARHLVRHPLPPFDIRLYLRVR